MIVRRISLMIFPRTKKNVNVTRSNLKNCVLWTLKHSVRHLKPVVINDAVAMVVAINNEVAISMEAVINGAAATTVVISNVVVINNVVVMVAAINKEVVMVVIIINNVAAIVDVVGTARSHCRGMQLRSVHFIFLRRPWLL